MRHVQRCRGGTWHLWHCVCAHCCLLIPWRGGCPRSNGVGVAGVRFTFFLGTQAHEHGNVLRGPAWSYPPASLSADAAHMLCTALFLSYATSGSHFASCSIELRSAIKQGTLSAGHIKMRNDCTNTWPTDDIISACWHDFDHFEVIMTIIIA